MTDFYGLSPIDIAAIVYVLLTIIGLMIVYSILKRIVRKFVELWSRGSLFGADLKTRLISLGIVAILFPSMFYFIGNAMINFIGNFYVDVPQSLFNNWQTNQTFCADYNINVRLCVSQLGYGFVQAWTSAFSDALNRFGPGYISYSKLILMLAVWAGLAIFLSTPSSKDKGIYDPSDQKIRLQNFFDKLSDTTKQNLMFFSILVLAGYLSIAAIAAIPGLEETAVPSEAVSVERLEQQLQDALSQSQSRIPIKMEFAESILAPTVAVPTSATTAGEATSTNTGEATPSSTPEVATTTTSMNNDDTYIKLRREQWSGTYAKLRENAIAQAENSKTSAVSAYRASVLERKGTKETIQHFLDIDAWYRQELNRMEAQLTECRNRVGNVDGLVNTLYSQDSDNTYTSPVMSQLLQNAERDAQEACQSVGIAARVPERQDLGSNMGPFSYIASWLLRTESLPLAQIVGLLGFGLLGSAVSSLVRNSGRRPKNKPLVEELATVIIRGATAAVVIFLAVKGGLAIFTSGESNANSYVLLLTCLVAAVFSEDVWAEAHNRLNKGLRGDDEPPTPEAEPAPPAPVSPEPLVTASQTDQIVEKVPDNDENPEPMDDSLVE